MLKNRVNKIITLALVMLLVISSTSITFAKNTKEEKVKKKEILFSIEFDGTEELEEIHTKTKKIYKELGIEKVMMDLHKDRFDNGQKLIDEIIYIEYDENNSESNDVGILSTIIGTTNLTDYNGYSFRYITVEDGYLHKSVDKAATGRAWVDVLDTAISVGLGFWTPWVWVPATMLGIDVASSVEGWWTGADVTRDEKWMVQLSEKITTRVYEIKDKDNKIPNHDWYAFATTNKSFITAQNTLTKFDSNYNLVYPRYFEEYKTLYAEYYFDTTYMKARTLDAYLGYGGEFYDRTPFPQVQ